MLYTRVNVCGFVHIWIELMQGNNVKIKKLKLTKI